MKAGTSWWYRLIADHPGVTDVASRPKEVHFFDRYAVRDFHDGDIPAYERFFPRAEGTIVGEWTPRYVYDCWTPALLARAAPAAKLLVILRDPVDRYVSGLTHDLSRGRSFDLERSHSHFARGQYLGQLRLLFSHVPRDRVLVLQYESCAAQPEAELARTYDFLGVDGSHRPASLRGTVNETLVEKCSLPASHQLSMARAYASELDELSALCPDLDLGLWKTTTELAGW